MSMFIDPVTGRPRQLELTRGQQPQAPQQDARIFGQPAAAPTGFEAALEAERRRLMAAQPQPVVEEDDGTAFGRGLRRGIPQTLSSLAAGAGALGFEDVQDYLSGIATEQEMAILRENPELLEGVDFRDIRGLNSFLSYLGELAGEQAPLIGGTLLAGGAAALAGASLPVAAVIGTAAASGPLLFGSNVQRRAEVLGIDPEDLASEDVSRAALTAIGQTALESATNVLLVGRLGAGVGRQVLENVTAEALAEVGQQALERAQAGLDVDSPDAYEEYLQAGIAGAALGGAFGGAGAIVGAGRERGERTRQLDEDQTEEAIQNTLEAQRAEEGRQKEIAEQAAAPTTDGAIALPAPENRISETDQNQMLKRIQREQASNFRRIRLSSLPIEERLILAKAREAARQPRRLTTTVQELQAVLGSEVAAREAAKQKPALAAAGQGVYTVPQSAKFNQDQIEAAIARIQATGKINFPIVRRAIAEVTEGNVPNEVTRSVIDELVTRGLVRRIDQNGKKKYEVEPDIKPVAEQAPVARERRELDRLEQEVQQAQERRDMLAEDIRRVEQTGQTIEGRKIKPGTARNLLRQADEQLSTLKNQAEQARQRVRGLNLQSTVPTRERVAPRADEAQARARMEALEQEITNEKKRLSNIRRAVTRAGDRATAQQRENLALQEARIDRLRTQREKINARLLNPSAAVQVKPEETAGQQARVAAGFEAEAGSAATTQAYDAAYSGVLGNLRKRLDGMGLKDVALEFDERMLKEQGADGSYANKLIKLASGIYDPDLTEQQLTDRMAAIMDHEVIHALRGMNLFSQGEWQSLSRAAAQQKYVAIKNGKPTERAYSYLDRARKMYPDQSPEIQIEEAVAEMFRQHTGGTKRFTGRPGNLLQRIVNFFKSVFRANADSGFQKPSDIFERAQRGEIAARRETEAETAERLSRRVALPEDSPVFGSSGVSLFDDPLYIEGKPTVLKIGQGMTQYHQNVYGRQLFPEDSDADYDLVLDVATEELAEQMKQPNSGAGWYGKDVQLAVDLTSQVYPRIAEPEGRSLYLTLAGIYSSGLEPEQAWLISGEAFEAWQETGVIPSTREEAARLLGREPKMTTFRDKSGQMITRPAGWSPRNQANVQQINMFKDLVEREGSIQNAVNWLSSLQSRQDINQVMLDAGMSTPRFKTKTEQAGPDAFGALIFGEKLGRYTIGLHGVEITADDATVDLWYTRSYRRWTGRLLEKPVGKEGIAAQPDPARGGIERQTIFRLTDDLSKRFSDMPPGDVQAMLWFFEKRLWGAQGLRTNEGTNSAGARQLLASRGIEIDERVGGPTAREPIGKEPARATGEREQRLSRRARAQQGRDAEGTGRYDTNPQIAPREVRSPDRRPAAESGLTELEPVTSEDLSNLNEDFFRRPGWAIVTATREDLDPQFKDSMNTRLNNQLQEQLDYQNIPYLKIEGRYEGEDQGVSFLIIAPRATAEKIGKQAMQESILTNEGLVYTLRPLPTTPSTGSITVGDQARAQDFYSQTPDGFAFSMDLNFDIGPGRSVFPENSYERTDRPQLPIRKNDNLVELFHWSDQELTEVDPAFAGTGPLKGAERRRGARLGFFGINPRQSQREPGTGYVKEPGLGQIMHRALVDPDTLYPFNEDPAGFKDQLTTTAPDDKVSEYEQLIRDAGYAGYYMTDNGSVRSSSAPLGNVAAMFEPVPVEPAEGTRLSRRVMFSVAQQMTNEASGTSNMTAIQKQVTQYTDIADWLGKAVGIVVRKPGRAQEIADKFIQKTQDSFIPVARMIKELKDRGLTILDTIDPYLQQQLSKSRAGALIDERKRGIYKQAADAIKQLNVSENMKQSLINVSRQNATRGYGLAQIYFDRMGSDKLAMADIFLYAQHALERNAYVRQIDQGNQSGSGMSDAEAQAILDWFDNNLDPANREAISRIDAAIKNIVRDTNQVRTDGDLIPSDVMNVEYNKKGVQAPQFEHYVPLRGVFDDDATVDYGDSPAGKRFTVRGREDQRILGRGADQYGTDILANLLFQNTNSIIRAEQNKVALALADLMESNPEMTNAYGEILETLPQRRVLNAYGQVQYVTDQRAKDENDIVVAKRNGQEIIMRMADANLAGAFNGKNVWNAGHANVILRGMAKVNRYLSNIVTSWNPEFVISNFSRDLQNAGINVSEFDLPGLRRDVVGNIPKALAGLKRAIRDGNYDSEWAQLYEDFARAGGQSAANPMNTLADQVEQVESLIKDFGEGGTLADLKRNGGKVLKFLEDYNTVVENAVRLTTFDALRKRGFSEARAAQAARGVTVDFTKTGDMGQFMNSMYLFYNAALQGSFFMFRAAARSKRVRRVLAGAIAMGVVSDFINSMVSGEDEAGTDEYDKIPDYILEHNWVIMLPEGLAPSGRRYIAIPMPYGLNFFYNTGRAISRAGRGGYEIDQAAKSITGTFLEVINPLGGTEHFLNFAAPTIADPFISLYGTNIDFTGRDIRREPFPNQQIARSHLYWNNTSPTAIQASQALNSLTGGTETYGGWADISPNTLEFWFDYITGGAGRFVQRTVELPVRVAEAQSNEDIIREVPLIRRMFGSISSREDLGSYIRNRDRVLVPRNEMRDAVDQQNRERIARLREQYSAADFRLAEQINRIENQRRQITRQMNAVRDNPNMSEDRKRELLDRLDARQQQVILRGLQLMRGQD